MSIENIIFNKRKKTAAFILLLFFCLIISGCRKKAEESSVFSGTEDMHNSEEELYIFQSLDKDNGMLNMINVNTGADAVFAYSGRTEILSQQGESTVVDRLECGELVRVVYSTRDNILNYVHVAKDRWMVETTGRYLSRQPDIGGIKVEGNVYKLNENYIIYSNKEKIDMDNIVENDALVIRGVGNTAYTITVTSGHGILTLKNSAPYIGGWIELGKTISVIKEGMILDVPEGDYNAILTRHGCKGEMVVSITRDKETVIDCLELKETKTRTGIVTFSVTPEEAEIFINGSKLGSREPLELTYGKYYLVIKASGYTTYGATMVVGSARANINISLDKETPGSSARSSSESSATSSGTASSGSSSSGASSSTRTSTYSTMNSEERSSMIQSLLDKYRLDNSSLFN